MATSSLGHGEVKSIENSLEVSPSQHQGTSSIYSGSHDNPKAKAHSPKHASGAHGKVTASESGFGEKGKSMRRDIAAGKGASKNKGV